MANIKGTTGTTQVTFTLTSGQKIVFPASATTQVFLSTSDMTDLARSGLLDAAIAGGKLTTLTISLDDAVALTDALGTGSQHIYLGRQVFSATGTYTPTPGCNRALVRMVGAGGGGGGVANSSSAQTAVGGGGASGDYFEKYVDPGAYPLVGGAVTIGAAGAAGANTGASGGTGGDTTIVIAGTTYTAKGGTGGGNTGSALTAQVVAGGASQAGSSTGDVTIPAEAGGPGNTQSGTLGISGFGGNSPWGSGGAGKIVQGAGTAGAGFGAGGAGGLSINAGGAVTGGAGTAGRVIVDEYT